MRLITAFFALTLLPVAVSGQRVIGRVLEAGTDKPVANVEVRLDNAVGTVTRVLTDSAGRFVLRAKSAGDYQVITSHITYAAVRAPVNLATEDQLEVVLHLSIAPTELPAVVVVGRSRAPDPYLERSGFYDRKAAPFGVFRAPEDIEKRKPFATSDLFQGINGVRVLYGGIRGKDIRMTRGEDPTCPPRVIVDNVIVRRGGRDSRPDEQPIDLVIQPQDIAGIEIYRSPSETPKEFGGMDVTCGVVLFWTKRAAVR